MEGSGSLLTIEMAFFSLPASCCISASAILSWLSFNASERTGMKAVMMIMVIISFTGRSITPFLFRR